MYDRLSKLFFALSFAAAATARALPAKAALTTPILEYGMNSTGSAVPNSGSVGAPGNLTMYGSGAPGSATDFHSADGGGVSGLAGDRAFDNTGSTAMGSLGTPYTSSPENRGPRATNDNAANAILAGQTQLTITGWLKSDTVWNGAAQVWAGDAGSFMNIRGGNTNGSSPGALTFQFQTTTGNNNSLSSPTTAFNQTNQWMFFAVVWNGGAVGSLEYFNIDGSNLVQSVMFNNSNATLQGAITNTSGAQVIGSATYGLTVGNQGGLGLRPYDGLIDNVRVFNSALTAADLQVVVNSDLQNVAVPEPSGLWLLLIGGISAGIAVRVKSRPLMGCPLPVVR